MAVPPGVIVRSQQHRPSARGARGDPQILGMSRLEELLYYVFSIRRAATAHRSPRVAVPTAIWVRF